MFFLNAIGLAHTEEEVREMVKILDIRGQGRVYKAEFLKLALGKSLTPIGFA